MRPTLCVRLISALLQWWRLETGSYITPVCQSSAREAAAPHQDKAGREEPSLPALLLQSKIEEEKAPVKQQTN